ncbi:MAG TPA: prephenate dehydrogenase/arogenate dehydrogenase family protein [Ktedonobacterales bacterium]|nr:prephenate dehydrogenase/arogenate dehydrogenase family protein [Ktedonobacterales bacterium]
MTKTEPPLFQRAAIIGLGLMGGSLGLALRATGATAHVIGYDAGPQVAAEAQSSGAVDEAAPTIAACVAGADLVVLATPVMAMRAILAEAAPVMLPGALVTDLGSTKAAVMAWAEASLPSSAGFIGGHPMAGSERSGIAAASAALFQGAVWCLTPGATADANARERLRAVVRRLGARPLEVEAARHDAAVARVSHLPLVAATALVLAASAGPEWDFAGALAAGGFRDATRIASGNPEMARDICLTNAVAILSALDDYIATLGNLREQIAAGDSAVIARFAEAAALRDGWLRKHQGRP